MIGDLRRTLIVEKAIYSRFAAPYRNGETLQRLMALEEMIHEAAVFWKHCRTEEGWKL